MGALVRGKISYTEWLKFVWKPILIWIIICSVAMSIALVIMDAKNQVRLTVV